MEKFFALRTTRYPTLYSIMVSILLALVVGGCGSETSKTTPGGTGTVTSGKTPVISNSGTITPASTPTPATLPPGTLPHYDHIVVAIEENHSYANIIGSSEAPYINSLASQGTLFTDSHGTQHPSEPNYLSLFAGSTFGLTDDSCPVNESGPNLGGELIAKSDTFAGYSESLPGSGSTDCSSSDGLYARKHNPWANFSDVSGPKTNLPFTSFPTDFTSLPTVAFVVPNLQNDMHDGPVPTGDAWLKDHLNSYIQWAKTHNSLFILTWDEDDGSDANHIPTIFVGEHVKAGHYGKRIDHYSVLSTIEDIYGLKYTNSASEAMAIKDIWQ
jgi:acid phosphatase